MLAVMRQWYERNFSDPQAVILIIILVVGFLIVIYMGNMLALILTSIIIAYMLEAVVAALVKYRVPRLISVNIICLVFLMMLAFLILWLIPVLSGQITQLVQELPIQIDKGQQALLRLPELYLQIVSEA